MAGRCLNALSRTRRWTTGSVAAVLLLGSCGDDCDTHGSCYPHGIYVNADETLDTSTATICIDGDCVTVRPGEGEGNYSAAFFSGTWEPGREVALKIEVFDSSGGLIDSVTEERTMDRTSVESGGCGCGAFYYGWRDGELYEQD